MFLSLVILGVAAWLVVRVQRSLEEKHRAMLTDLHDGLVKQGDRLGGHLAELRESLGAKLETRLDQISGKVNERLDEGFKKTNETFVSVMARLATIDEAQKKIETPHQQRGEPAGAARRQALARRVRRGAARGAGAQHAAAQPPSRCSTRCPTAARADCVLKLPEPTGMVAVDSKFPLENYHRMFDPSGRGRARAGAERQFRADVQEARRRHREQVHHRRRDLRRRGDVRAGRGGVRRDPRASSPRWWTTRCSGASGSCRRPR